MKKEKDKKGKPPIGEIKNKQSVSHASRTSYFWTRATKSNQKSLFLVSNPVCDD